MSESNYYEELRLENTSDLVPKIWVPAPPLSPAGIYFSSQVYFFSKIKQVDFELNGIFSLV